MVSAGRPVFPSAVFLPLLDFSVPARFDGATEPRGGTAHDAARFLRSAS